MSASFIKIMFQTASIVAEQDKFVYCIRAAAPKTTSTQITVKYTPKT
ncbi:hypothetical protein LVJ85_12135 [Neisseria sp. Dent CA1/247]|nr:hypothetical protein [Neisseria sp. Dent CA1/247]UOO76732.1 hypothetical protein LVJ85_12135 [Neisseria sp. Dent CA1/247]